MAGFDQDMLDDAEDFFLHQNEFATTCTINKVELGETIEDVPCVLGEDELQGARAFGGVQNPQAGQDGRKQVEQASVVISSAYSIGKNDTLLINGVLWAVQWAIWRDHAKVTYKLVRKLPDSQRPRARSQYEG